VLRTPTKESGDSKSKFPFLYWKSKIDPDTGKRTREFMLGPSFAYLIVAILMLITGRTLFPGLGATVFGSSLLTGPSSALVLPKQEQPMTSKPRKIASKLSNHKGRPGTGNGCKQRSTVPP
jgi:hypothetical protein